jgi:hypothetical protein
MTETEKIEAIAEKLFEKHIPANKLTPRQLEAVTDVLLREDARREVCRECNGRGEKTGGAEHTTQPATDAEGNPLEIDWPEYTCANGHIWFAGEGGVRGIGGDSPILFEEHFHSRKRREIYTSVGTPDPSIVAGIYNRTHPQGRKVNSEEQRKRNGASFFR